MAELRARERTQTTFTLPCAVLSELRDVGRRACDAGSDWRGLFRIHSAHCTPRCLDLWAVGRLELSHVDTKREESSAGGWLFAQRDALLPTCVGPWVAGPWDAVRRHPFVYYLTVTRAERKSWHGERSEFEQVLLVLAVAICGMCWCV